MKKTIHILAILAVVLMLSACKSTDISDQPQASTSESQPQAAAQQTSQTETQPEPSVDVPADTYRILATDTSDKFIMKYKIDPDSKWKVKTATFEMRNFGDEAITPKVDFIVGSAGATGELRTFEYAPIPPGYKMIKQETVDMDIEDEHVYIKATLKDKATGEEIGSVNYDYFAK